MTQIIVRTVFGSRLLGIYLILTAYVFGYYIVNSVATYTHQGNFAAPIPLTQQFYYMIFGVGIALEFIFLFLEWFLFRQKKEVQTEENQYEYSQ